MIGLLSNWMIVYFLNIMKWAFPLQILNLIVHNGREFADMDYVKCSKETMFSTKVTTHI